MIRLRFVTCNDLVSRVIRSGEMGFGLSHVEAVVDGGYLGAHADGGVQLRSIGYDKAAATAELFVDLPATDAQTAVFNGFLKAQIGKPYDMAAIEGMLEGAFTSSAPAGGTAAGFICSALIEAGVYATGLWPTLPSRYTTPRDVWRMCAALVKIGAPTPLAPRRFKFGRIRPTERPALRLSKYLDHATLPTPPVVCHWTHGYTALRNILANDRLGDCTSAGAGHILDTWRINAGNGERMVTEADAIAFYAKSTGYDPANPASDQGGDEISVLNCWRDHGYFADGSSKIVAYAAVDAANVNEIKQAIYLLENLYLGIEMPDAWVQNEPSADGFVWDVAGEPNPSNGHCFVGVGFNAPGVIINSWGLTGTLTWAALAKYGVNSAGGEVYTVFSPDAINRATQKAPNGFDAATLAADIARL